MLAKIKSFLGTANQAVDEDQGDPLTAAAAAVLVEAAMTDGTFGDDERTAIIDVLSVEFDMSPDDAADLIDEAAADPEHANKLYAATRTIRDEFDEEQRIDMMVMLWRVAYADGVLHDYEANLVRRVAGLLYVKDQDSGRARKIALQQLDIHDNG